MPDGYRPDPGAYVTEERKPDYSVSKKAPTSLGTLTKRGFVPPPKRPDESTEDWMARVSRERREYEAKRASPSPSPPPTTRKVSEGFVRGLFDVRG